VSGPDLSAEDVVYHRIMVPLDGSRFAESVLPIALAISRRTGTPLHFVTVQEPVPSFAYEEWEATSREWSQSYLEGVTSRAAERTEGELTWELLTGHVAESLEEEARAREVDLVAMATHGRGMFSRAWLGSVTASFVHHTDLPVLLVRPEDGEEVDLSAAWTPGKVLIPLDGSDLSESALHDAVELGTLFSAVYHLVRVVPYPMDIASSYLPHTVQMNQGLVEEAKVVAIEYLEGHATALGERDLQVTTGVLVDAQPGHGILKEAEAQGCDFIAMATHGRSGLTRAILGSASDKVLRGTHVPLLLHRPTL
jgi:nucleotide-binding universal stress UspA family protein